MYTLLIVDDEPLIRNGVKKIIDWESLGFSEICLAEDGQEALDIVRTRRIDLVLTDIVMPFMDGLELTRILSREYPDTHVVILTGHEDFEYAQQSIGLGVKNYILKPVGAETLNRKMKEICENLHIANKQKQYITSMKSQLQQSIPLLQEQMLCRVICHPGRDIEKYEKRFPGLKIELGKGPYKVGLVELDAEQTASDEKDLYLFAAKQIIGQSLGKRHYVLEDARDRLIVLFCCDCLGDYEDIDENVYQLLEVIQKMLQSRMDLQTTCAVGSLSEHVAGLNQSYQDARKALECRYSLGTGNVYDFRDLDYVEKSFYYAKNEIGKLISGVKNGSQTEIDAAVHGIMTCSENGRPLSAMNMQMNYIASVTALLRELSEVKAPSQEVWQNGMDIFRGLGDLRTVREMEQGLCRFSKQISGELDQIQKNSSRQIIDRVIRYVESHYMDPELSLSKVSEYASVSTGYLSALFKKETGTNFVKYLMDIRMEKCKELLLTTDHKTYEIAYETGFADSHYFSIAFKKHTGMSPSEFRSALA